MNRQYQNYGRDQINVENNENLTIHQYGVARSDQYENALLKLVENEVNRRLALSLYKSISIPLEKDSQPQQIEHPCRVEVKIGNKPRIHIPPDAGILEIFENPEFSGQLLILGKPGSGKTTVMLELAQSLLAKARQDVSEPIPILFNLETWANPNQSIPSWVIEELNAVYNIPRKVAKTYLAQKRLLPMLDGLDEVRAGLQANCIRAINQWLSGKNKPTSIVICSRQEEYNSHTEKLNLSGAIALKELTDEQIENFLNKIQRAHLSILIKNDSNLDQLSRTPLLLNIIALTFDESSAEELKAIASKEQTIDSLLESYVHRMFERKLKDLAYKEKDMPSLRKSQKWLTFLAKQLQNSSKTDFLIEKIQPSQLERKWQKRRYETIYGLIYGTILHILVFYIYKGIFPLPLGIEEYARGFIFSLISSGILALIYTVFGFYKPRKDIDLAESIVWSPEKVKETGRNILNTWMVFTLILNVGSYGLTSWQVIIVVLVGLFTRKFWNIILAINLFGALEETGLVNLLFSLIVSLPIGLLFTFLFSLNNGLGGSEIDVKRRPNQGIWKTLSNSWLIAAVYGFIFSGILITFLAIGGEIGLYLQNWMFRIWIHYSGSGIAMGNTEINTVSYTMTRKLFPLEYNFYRTARISIYSSVVFGVIIGMLSGLLSGFLKYGKECLKHFSLRLVLFHSGYIPWNYSRFLNYGTERLILQRVGGRYRFMHRILQNYFLNMPELKSQ